MVIDCRRTEGGKEIKDGFREGEEAKKSLDKRDAYGPKEVDGGIKGRRQKINTCVCGE